MLWRDQRSGLGYQEGFYIFGGMDERGVLHNDLWLAVPDYDYNRYMIAAVDHDYVGNKKLGLTLRKLQNYSGMAPCPRSQFQMITLKSAGE